MSPSDGGVAPGVVYSPSLSPRARTYAAVAPIPWGNLCGLALGEQHRQRRERKGVGLKIPVGVSLAVLPGVVNHEVLVP